MLDSPDTRWQKGRDIRASRDDETLSATLLHLVERRDLQHAAVGTAPRRARGRRRVRQPLLPDEGRRARSEPRFRTALGHLQWLCRSLDDPAGVARLDAP